MEHYVTLFDSLFLPQGLALHRSMERHAGPFTLWVLCVDARCVDVLRRLQLPNVRLLPLSDLENAELRAVKPSRSRAEYCWTLTPFAPRFVFETDATVQQVTYVDADMWFRANPGILLEGFARSGKSVQITDHAYAPEYDQSAQSGRFCVQFMTFSRPHGEGVRAWWEARCLEWCYARIEDGKFGDQLYLDDWPERFSDQVHVLQDIEKLQAPWNATRFAPARAVGFHFHGLRLLASSHVLLTDGYRLNASTLATLYRPYIADLEQVVEALRKAGHSYQAQRNDGLWKLRARNFGRRLRGLWRRSSVAPIVRLRGN